MSIKKIINPNNDDFVILVDNGSKIPSILTKAYFDNLVVDHPPKKRKKPNPELKDMRSYYEKKLNFYKKKLKEKKVIFNS